MAERAIRSRPHELVQLNPAEILYTQDIVKCHFEDGTNLADTFRSLLYGTSSPGDLESMDVMLWDQKYWVVEGNRRLYLFKQLEKLNITKQITAIKIPEEKWMWRKIFRNSNHGKTVSVINEKDLNQSLDKIIKVWRYFKAGKCQAEINKDYRYRYETMKVNKMLRENIEILKKEGFWLDIDLIPIDRDRRNVKTADRQKGTVSSLSSISTQTVK
ncbi:unnamed protein product [Owenia fusiformis]|uniref:Uncharacterized protein n=1 Tax=Owenia fusiformis TaxID=6347 RepID=A0A8J1UC72_OWEFU|nr:unnamed protein product [Owenia fusiformis]